MVAILVVTEVKLSSLIFENLTIIFFQGIQEDESGKGIFIFSVWDSRTDKTKSISKNHHPECVIRRFGGEGVGMQCLLYKDWNVNDTVTQKIIGELVSHQDGKQTWHISCEVLPTRFSMLTEIES